MSDQKSKIDKIISLSKPTPTEPSKYHSPFPSGSTSPSGNNLMDNVSLTISNTHESNKFRTPTTPASPTQVSPPNVFVPPNNNSTGQRGSQSYQGILKTKDQYNNTSQVGSEVDNDNVSVGKVSVSSSKKKKYYTKNDLMEKPFDEGVEVIGKKEEEILSFEDLFGDEKIYIADFIEDEESKANFNDFLFRIEKKYDELLDSYIKLKENTPLNVPYSQTRPRKRSIFQKQRNTSVQSGNDTDNPNLDNNLLSTPVHQKSKSNTKMNTEKAIQKVKLLGTKYLPPVLQNKITEKMNSNISFNNRIEREYTYHKDCIWKVNCMPNYSKKNLNIIATCSADKKVCLWDDENENPMLIYKGHKGSVNDVRFHPKYPFVCSASGDKTLQVWKVRDLLLRYDPNYTYEYKPFEHKHNSDDPNVNAEKMMKSISIEFLDSITDDMSYTQRIHKLSEEQEIANDDATQDMFSDEFSHDSLLGSDIEDEMEKEKNYEMKKNQLLKESKSAVMFHPDIVKSCDWMYGGESIVTACWDSKMRVFPFTHFEYDSTEYGEVKPETKFEGTPRSQSSFVRVIKPLGIYTGHDDILNSVRSAETSLMAVTSSRDSTVKLWDFRLNPKQACINTLKSNESINCAIFAVNDRFILTGGEDSMLRVWDVKNLKSPLNTINLHGSINNISVSDYNSQISVALTRRQTKIIDISGTTLKTLEGSKRDYLSCSKEKNGLNDFMGHTLMVCDACWSNDGSYVYTTSVDMRTLKWRISDIPKEPIITTQTVQNINITNAND